MLLKLGARLPSLLLHYSAVTTTVTSTLNICVKLPLNTTPASLLAAITPADKDEVTAQFLHLLEADGVKTAYVSVNAVYAASAVTGCKNNHNPRRKLRAVDPLWDTDGKSMGIAFQFVCSTDAVTAERVCHPAACAVRVAFYSAASLVTLLLCDAARLWIVGATERMSSCVDA